MLVLAVIADQVLHLCFFLLKSEQFVLLRFHEFLSLLELRLQLIYLGDLLGVFLFLCVDFLIKGFQFGVAIFKLASVGLFICLFFG